MRNWDNDKWEAFAQPLGEDGLEDQDREKGKQETCKLGDGKTVYV